MTGGRGTSGRRAAVLVALAAAAAIAPAMAGGAADSPEPFWVPAPAVIAHRGASAEAPEHTFAAYDRAVEAGADVIECDLQLTKDEVLVCVHDTTVDRTTGGTATGRVDSFTLAELREMDFGSWFGPEFAGASIVPFEEQLRCYGGGDVQFYAETKAPAEYGGRMEPKLVELLRRLDLVPRRGVDPRLSPVIVQSFELESLAAVKRLAPSLPTAWLWAIPPTIDARREAASARIDIMAPTASYLLNLPQEVTLAHQTARLVHTWTVDDPAQMEQLLDAGVDGIFTNRPDVLREIVDRRADRPPHEAVDLEPGCPGVAATVTAVETGDGGTGDGARRAVAERVAEDDDVDWVPVTVAVVTIALVAGIIVWILGRRRPR